MSNITMFDSIDVSQLPSGSGYAYAGYVNGAWPTYSSVVAKFPGHHVLSIAVNAGANADCLDIETGDATPADAAGWYLRQHARGVTRPCLYANASTMGLVIAALKVAGISRNSVRLWSAHYDGQHICGPSSCRMLSETVDGTQWTFTALGRNLDQSTLAPDFFGAAPIPPKPQPKEKEVQSGLLSVGPNAVTPISVPWGSGKNIAFGCDNGVQGLPAPKLRVAIFDTAWHVSEVTVDSTKGQTVVYFPNAAKTGVISVKRMDTGDVPVAYEVS